MSSSRIFRSLLLALVAALALGGLTATSAVAAGGRIAGTVYAPNGTTPTEADLNLLKLVDGEWEWYFQETYTNETDLGDGKYEFTNLPAGSYKVQVSPWEESYQTPIYHDSVSWIDDDAPAFSVGSSGTVTKNVTMKPGRTVSGHLTKTGGAAAVDTCTFEGDVEPCPAEAWAGVPLDDDYDYTDVGRLGTADDSDGSYTITGLPPTTVRVCAYGTDSLAEHCWDDQPYFETADDISVASTNQSGIDIELPLLGTVSGVITDGTDPLEGVNVAPYSLFEGEWAPTYDDVETDENGEFSVKLNADDYRFCFEASGFADECFDDVESVEAGTTRTLAGGGTVDLGTVELSRGNSVSGTLRLGKTSPKNNTFYVDAFKRQGDGSYEYDDYLEVTPNQEWEFTGLTNGTYKFAFSDELSFYGSAYYLNKSTLAAATPVTVDGSNAAGIDATLQPGASLSGKVTGPTNKGQTSDIWVYEPDASQSSGWSAEATYYGAASSSGAYTIKGLPAGQYRVEFDAPWTSYANEFYNDAPTIQTADTVTVSAGKTTSNINAQLTTSGPQLTSATPTISSSKPVVGVPLTANPGTWKPKNATLSYQWFAGGVEIDGAESKTYTPSVATLGKKIRVDVTGVAGPLSKTVSSKETSSATAKGTQTGSTPTLSNTKPKVDASPVLSVNLGTWPTGEDVTTTYQWLRDGKSIPAGEGGTASTYQVVGADLGKTISVTVKAVRAGYNDLVKTSSKSSKVAAATFSTKPTVVAISGNLAAGQTLSAELTGGFTPTVTPTYQWSVGGKAVKGATSATYLLKGVDAGKKVSVTVSGVKQGYTTASVKSADTAVVAKGSLQPQPPTVTGGDAAEVGKVLTVGGTDWTPVPGETVLKYQWQSAAAPTGPFTNISKATGKTYTPVAADLDRYLRVQVTGSATGYNAYPATETAEPTEKVAPGTIVPGQVKITLPKGVTNPSSVPTGSKLTASAGTWGPKGVKLTYKWYRVNNSFSDRTEIPGTSGKTSYTTTAADANQRVIFAVVCTLAGYESEEQSAEVRGPNYVEVINN